MYFINKTPLFSPIGANYVKFTKLNPYPDGSVTVSYSDGLVLSVAPNGQWDTRPVGTDGPWERATVNGNTIIFAGTGTAFVYAIFENKYE